MPSTATTHELQACTDCIMLIANGDTSGTPRCETEEGEAEYLAAVAANTGHLHLAPSDWDAPVTTYEADDSEQFAALFDLILAGEIEIEDCTFDLDWNEWSHKGWTETDRYYGTPSEARFTYYGCDVCGDGLGGDKHPVAGWER